MLQLIRQVQWRKWRWLIALRERSLWDSRCSSTFNGGDKNAGLIENNGLKKTFLNCRGFHVTLRRGTLANYRQGCSQKMKLTF